MLSRRIRRDFSPARICSTGAVIDRKSTSSFSPRRMASIRWEGIALSGS